MVIVDLHTKNAIQNEIGNRTYFNTHQKEEKKVHSEQSSLSDTT